MSVSESDSARQANDRPEWLEIVRKQVASLRYGVVQIVVHDSQVTQIEKTERVRLDKPASQTKTIWADRKAGA
ncbi:MAG: YezD family protein [Verrucomicrobiia bacterium]